jgi:hypothetical protein
MLGSDYIPKNKIVKKLCEEFHLNIYADWKKAENHTIYNLFDMIITYMYNNRKTNDNCMLINNSKPQLTNWNQLERQYKK